MILAVDRDRILSMWPQVEGLVDKALRHSEGEFEKTDILHFLLNRDMQLWVAMTDQIHGMCVTQILNFPRFRACQVVLMAGENAFGNWIEPMIAEVEMWAKRAGCNRIQEMGRAGWERVLPKLVGARKAYTLMVKNL